MRYIFNKINRDTKIVKLPIYPIFEDKFIRMDKKEAYQQIIYKLKEIDGTRLRLTNSRSETTDIELALLNQQIINLYQHLQNYRSGLYASQPQEKKSVAEESSIHYIPVKEAPEPEPAKETIKAATPPAVEIKKSEVELKRENTDSQQRKERLKRIEAEAARAEQAKQKATSNPVPAPKGEEEDFTKIVEEKYNEADIAEAAAKSSGRETELYTLKNKEPLEVTLNEKLQSGHKPSESLNEKFQHSDPKKTLADKMKLGPISDLKSAIALNQKIAFTNALFGGDDKEFKKALTFLNNCTNFSEAKFYLQSEIGKIHNWNENDPMVEEFTELVYRKFL
jgi:hypothetical protein